MNLCLSYHVIWQIAGPNDRAKSYNFQEFHEIWDLEKLWELHYSYANFCIFFFSVFIHLYLGLVEEGRNDIQKWPTKPTTCLTNTSVLYYIHESYKANFEIVCFFFSFFFFLSQVLRGVSRRSPIWGPASHWFWHPGAKLMNVALTPPPHQLIWSLLKFSSLETLLKLEWHKF